MANMTDVKRSVLVPIDGSERSLRAVASFRGDHVRGSTPDDCEVHLMNVQPALSRRLSQFVGHGQVADFRCDESVNALRQFDAIDVGTHGFRARPGCRSGASL